MMGKAFSVIKRAFALWWRELILLTFFNVAWFLLQIPIITGPPATAAMYVIARRVLDDELVNPRDGWAALRQMFLPAWKWGAANLVVLAALAFNFWSYREMAAQSWTVIRLLWTLIALGWYALNLFYWPFWLAQADRRMVNTYRNCLVLLFRMPVFSVALTAICAALVVGGVLLTLPLVVALMAWLALMGTLAVEEALKELTV
jgi:hypothetical protein